MIAVGLLALVIAVPLWVISARAFLAFPVWLFGRKELIITPSDFSVRTTLQPKNINPHVVQRQGARASSTTIIDSLFLTEVSGATASLIKAEVDPHDPILAMHKIRDLVDQGALEQRL